MYDEYECYRVNHRLVAKDGQLCRSQTSKILGGGSHPRLSQTQYIQNLHSYLVSFKWPLVVFLITLAHLISWLVFALLWYLVSLRHGDFDYNPNSNQTRQPCLLNVGSNFLAFFMFSIETQATIGYGYYQPSDHCFVSVILLALQASMGVLISMVSAGIVLTKLVQPKRCERLITFSQNAVVSYRDGMPCFMVCISNPHKVLITDSLISLLFVQLKEHMYRDNSGQHFDYREYKAVKCHDLHIDNGVFSSGALFLCPTIIEHVIDRSSALYPYLYLLKEDYSESVQSLFTVNQNFEIIVIVEGVVDSTGTPCHYRTSYLPKEILWGYRFKKLEFEIDNGLIIFDVTTVGLTEPVDSSDEE